MRIEPHKSSCGSKSELLKRAVDCFRNKLPYLVHPTTYSKHFHQLSYMAVDKCSPLILDQSAIEHRFHKNESIEYYDRQRQVTVKQPDSPSTHPEMEQRVGTYEISRPFVGSVRNAHLIGDIPVPIDRQGNVILEAVVSPEVLSLNLAHSITSFLKRPLQGLRKRRAGVQEPIDKAVLLFNCWNSGYFHWTVETLARLEGVEAYRRQTGTRPKLIVGPNPSEFQVQSLAMLGYEEADLLRWTGRHRTVDELIVPSVRRELNPGAASPVAHWWLHKRMRAAATELAPREAFNESKFVYVSREDASYRRVVNEEEVLDRLRPYGFEKYVLAEREMAKDVALFSQADVIVAPHGAGLTNVLYAEDATVIELFRSNHVQPVYFLLSKQLGHRYHYLLCPFEGTDIIVDVDELESVVQSAVSQQQSDMEATRQQLSTDRPVKGH